MSGAAWSNGLSSWLSGAAAERLTWSLVHFLWQGLVVALLYALLVRAVRDVRIRYAAGMAALLLMAACPLATWLALGPLETTPAPAPLGTPAEAAAASAPRELPPAPALARAPSRETDPAVSAPRQGAADVSPAAAETSPLLAGAQPLLLGVYLLGMAWMTLRLLVGWTATWRLRATARPAPAELLERLNEVAGRMGVRLRGRLRVTCRMAEAGAVGLWRPVILLPAAWLAQLPPETLEAVVAHELAHIRRGDLWANLLQRLIEAALFYHPAVWWVSRQVQQDREMCCDERAVSATERREDYVEALARAARLQSESPARRCPLHSEEKSR